MSDNADLLSGLNPEQYAAVTAPNCGSTLVLAGAGCGKTAVLTRRIVFLVRSGIAPQRICALTFSRKAAEEMAHRLAKLDDRCRGTCAPLVTTFHAFALRVLQQKFDGVRNFNRVGFNGEAVLLDHRQRLEILASVSTTAMRKTLRMSITELDSTLNLFLSFPEKISQKWSDTERELITKIERDFSEVRKSRGLWDFEDLIRGVIELFNKYPQIAASYSGQYDAILVDEFQDTNPMQIDLLDMLLSNGASLYAVGDDDQAIYGFRGADIRPIRNFTTRFNNASIIKLQINYRSIPPILNCANRLWLDKPAEYRKTLVSGLSTMPSGCRRPVVMRFKAHTQMLEWVLNKARFISSKENIPVNSMAMLFRINDTLNAVSDQYRDKGFDSESLPQMFTVHASKGLEYPVVFLCDLEEGVFPHYKLPKEIRIDSWRELLSELLKRETKTGIDCSFDEELRLFYVGVTRAQRFLYFVTVASKPFYGRMTNFVPSRFLKLVK
jgi:superfamily I DNA/RNA helicase